MRVQDRTGSTGSSVSNIYFKSDQEYLFLLEGKNYVLYQPENGTFIKQAGKKYQHTYIEALTEEFWGINFNNSQTKGMVYSR